MITICLYENVLILECFDLMIFDMTMFFSDTGTFCIVNVLVWKVLIWECFDMGTVWCGNVWNGNSLIWECLIWEQFDMGMFDMGTVWYGNSLIWEQFDLEMFDMGMFGMGKFDMGTVWYGNVWYGNSLIWECLIWQQFDIGTCIYDHVLIVLVYKTMRKKEFAQHSAQAVLTILETILKNSVCTVCTVLYLSLTSSCYYAWVLCSTRGFYTHEAFIKSKCKSTLNLLKTYY